MNTNAPIKKQLPIVSSSATFTEVGKGQHINNMSIGPIRDAHGVMIADADARFTRELARTSNPLCLTLRQGKVELGDFIIDRHTGHYVLTCFEPTTLFLDLTFTVGEASDLEDVQYK